MHHRQPSHVPGEGIDAKMVEVNGGRAKSRRLRTKGRSEGYKGDSIKGGGGLGAKEWGLVEGGSEGR